MSLYSQSDNMSNKSDHWSSRYPQRKPNEALPHASPINPTLSTKIEMGEEPKNAAGSQKEERREKTEDEEQEAAQEFPGPIQVGIIMTCILCAVFLMSLDRTIIATAVPRITDDFNSLGDIGWYGSAMMLTNTCFQFLWAKIYSFYSPKYVFLTVIIVFEIGSVICGAAPTSVAFICGRAIAGVGSAGILTGAIVLMAAAVPLPKRPFYNSFFSIALGTSSVVGPLIGGAFVSHASWRWCFYMNLPIGGVVMLVIILLLKPTPAELPHLTFRQQIAQLDLLGEIFLFASIACLLMALQWGGTTYEWSNWRLILLLVLFGVCLVAFTTIQIFAQDTATIKFRIIQNRSILSAMWFMFCLAAVMMDFIYYLPLWFQAVKGQTAIQSGISTLPLVVALTAASIFSGQTVGWIGYYTPLAIASSCFLSIGAGVITTFDVKTKAGTWIGYQILLGIGIGLGLQHGPMTAYTVLDRQDVPIGASLMFVCQQLAGAIFVSASQNVFNEQFLKRLQGVLKGISASDLANTGATALRSTVSPGDLADVLFAYNEALAWVWIIGVIMGCLSAIGSLTLEWRSVKDEQGPTKR